MRYILDLVYFRLKLIDSSKELLIPKYVIKEVKYSEKELLEAYELLNIVMENSELIQSIDVDSFNNRIVSGRTAVIVGINKSVSSTGTTLVKGGVIIGAYK